MELWTGERAYAQWGKLLGGQDDISRNALGLLQYHQSHRVVSDEKDDTGRAGRTEVGDDSAMGIPTGGGRGDSSVRGLQAGGIAYAQWGKLLGEQDEIDKERDGIFHNERMREADRTTLDAGEKLLFPGGFTEVTRATRTGRAATGLAMPYAFGGLWLQDKILGNEA